MWETQCNTKLTGEGMNDIEPCPKCKKKDGFHWTGSHFGKDTLGYSTCKSCKAEFH